MRERERARAHEKESKRQEQKGGKVKYVIFTRVARYDKCADI